MTNFFLLGVNVGPGLVVRRHTFIGSSIHVRKMYPNFGMVTVILLFKPQRATWDGEGSMHPDLPFGFRSRWFQETAYVRPFTWYTSRSPQRCGAGWHW